MNCKKLFVLFALLPLSLFLSNCGRNIETDNTLKGYITLVGNEPFAKLAIVTKDDKVYLLQTGKELEGELLKKQGNFYSLKYSGMKEKDGFTTIVVEKVIPLTKDEK